MSYYHSYPLQESLHCQGENLQGTLHCQRDITEAFLYCERTRDFRAYRECLRAALMERLGERVKRYLTLATGVIECFGFAGVIIGWPSLVFVLKTKEYFADLCLPVHNSSDSAAANATGEYLWETARGHFHGMEGRRWWLQKGHWPRQRKNKEMGVISENDLNHPLCGDETKGKDI